jgi:hypothetical protein
LASTVVVVVVVVGVFGENDQNENSRHGDCSNMLDQGKVRRVNLGACY